MIEEELREIFEEFEFSIKSVEENNNSITIEAEYKFDLIEIDAAISYSEEFEDIEEKIMERNSYLQDIAYDNIIDVSDEIIEEFEFTSVDNKVIPLSKDSEVQRSLDFIIYIKK